MTAPTWHVTPDPYGEPTLFHGDTAVFRESDFAVAGAEYRDQLWSVLTRVLVADTATVIHLARALWQDTSNPTPTPVPDDYCDAARYVLAALGAPEQTGPDGGQDGAVSL